MLKRIWAWLVEYFNPPPLDRRFSARITNVKDGDSLEFYANHRTHRARLVGIDAPEYLQPYGPEAARQLIELAYASDDVRIEQVGYDKFNRLLVHVTVGEVDLAHAMLDAGLAWHIASYTKQSIPQHAQRYAAAMYHAMEAKRGLWAQPNPMAPAQYRAITRGDARPANTPSRKPSAQRDLFT